MFLNPIGLALLGLCPLLIFAYRRKLNAKKKVVSSIILLKQLKTKARKKQKIKLPLRFFFELLGLCLLALAFALPISKSKKIAVVIDNSQSMSAIDEGGRSRLELAKQKFSEEKAGDDYKIFNISNSYYPDKMSKEIEKIHNKGTYDQIWVFSDKDIVSNNEVKSFRIGTERKNLFISDAKIKDQKITANIRHDSAEIEIKLEEIDFNGNVLNRLEKKIVKIESNYNYSYEIEAPGSAYKISVSTKEEDSIKNDNIAWLANTAQKTDKALLITEQSSLETTELLGLEKIENLKISKTNKYDGKDYSFLIFHKTIPEELPKIPSLFILPAEFESTYLNLKTSNRENINITYWDKSHEINSYLKLNLIKTIDAVNITPPLWTNSIINSEDASLLLVGIKNSVPLALSGIELLPYEGLKTPTLSILLVNIIKWLNQNKSISPELNTSEEIKIYNNSIVLTPEQTVIKDSKTLTLEKPGIYLFSPENKAIAVNNFHEEESQTNKIIEQNIELTKSEKKEKKSDLWKYLIYSGIFLLLIEMILRRKNV